MLTSRLLLSFTALGVCLLVPTMGYCAAPATIDEAVSEAASGPRLDITSWVEVPADGRADSEITFAGKANERVVVYVAEGGIRRFRGAIDLYTADGEFVRTEGNYPTQMTFGSSGGIYRTILLPETGVYRLVLTGTSARLRDDELPMTATNYLVQVRTATYYERLMIAAEALVDEQQYEAAFDRLALAVEDSPEIPAAYLSRIETYAKTLYESPAFEARINELSFTDDAVSDEAFEAAIFTLIYDTFLMLDAEDQSVVLSDLRQLDSLQIVAIASRKPDENEIEDFPYAEIVNFFETGISSDVLRRLFFGSVEQTQDAL